MYHFQKNYKVAAVATGWAWGHVMIFEVHIGFWKLTCWLQDYLWIWGCSVSNNPQNCQKSFQLWGLSKLKLFLESGMISRHRMGPYYKLHLQLWFHLQEKRLVDPRCHQLPLLLATIKALWPVYFMFPGFMMGMPFEAAGPATLHNMGIRLNSHLLETLCKESWKKWWWKSLRTVYSWIK